MASAIGYPITLVHPRYTPAVLNTPDQPFIGRPARFPPIEVHSPEDEEMFRAKGYLRQGEIVRNPVDEYERYPLMMRHPDYVAPVEPTSEAHNVDGQIVISKIPGRPGRNLDVIVNDEDEEDTWAAKGYRPAGEPSETAFETAKAAPGHAGSEWPKYIDGVLTQDPDAPAVDAHRYPMWVHFGDGRESVLVQNADEEARARGAQPVPQPKTEGPKPYVVPPAPAIDADELAAFRAWKATQPRPPEPRERDPERSRRAKEMWAARKAKTEGAAA